MNVRSDSVNVEQIMKQIRTRIREKRGSDYTQAELQQLASAKLEQFADPSGLRSDLLEQFRKRGDEPSTYHRHRGVRRWLLMMAHPILKRVQKQVMSDLNLYFEIIHNLVVETTRLGIEVQNLKMRVESLSSRVDFDERRARSLEGVVQYRQNRPAPSGPGGGSSQRSWTPAPSSPQAQTAPANSGSAVSYANSSVAAGSSVPVSPAGSAPGSSTAPSGTGTPGVAGQGQNGPGSSRRRRRRRRRRPGNTLADSPNAGSNQQSSPHGSSAQASNDVADNDGPDGDDGGSDGDDGAADQ